MDTDNTACFGGYQLLDSKWIDIVSVRINVTKYRTEIMPFATHEQSQ